MIGIIIEVLSNWQVIAAATLFILILVLLFSDKSTVSFSKPRKPARKKKALTKKKKSTKDKQTENSPVHKDEPGKLYVPDSTYEILKKEGIMHSHDDK